MRKNRVKISQSKPKKATLEQRNDMKALTLPKGSLNSSDSLSMSDIPEEPSFKLPRKSHNPIENEEIEDKSASSELITEKSVPKPDNLFETSRSDFESTPRQIIAEYSEIDGSQPKDLINQIKELQQEISEMNQRILYTEEEMKTKEVEAEELKELLIKLRENQIMIIETSDKQSNCKACSIY